MEKKGEGFALRRGLRWHREHEAIRPQTAGIGAGKAQGDVATRAPMYVIVPAHDWTHLAKESARPPLKSVDLRIALLSTNPLPSHLHPTINHQHLLNNPTTMNMFHVDNASASLSCGEDQTAAWSETTSAGYEATIAFDWGTSGPITVSTDLLWDMRGYSCFVVAKRLGIPRHLRRVAECRCRAGRSRDYQRRGAQPRLR